MRTQKQVDVPRSNYCWTQRLNSNAKGLIHSNILVQHVARIGEAVLAEQVEGKVGKFPSRSPVVSRPEYDSRYLSHKNKMISLGRTFPANLISIAKYPTL